ncbi:MAG: LytR C-terminal domain-containing protein [Actinomycetota bacterium]|nr:LytR C-terminal domain-containing protein [Actinomycetota bacterium]
MSPASHAADDGSFARSAGIQAGRAALLIGVAVLIGVLLLHRSPGGGGVSPVAVGDTATTATPSQTSGTTRPGGLTPTTPRAPVTTGGTSLRAPQDIKVLVANGTTTPGLAGKISNTLHAKGYNTLASTNSTEKPAGTIVYFQPSYSADAAALAGKLNLPPSAVQAMPQPPPVQNLNGANILVIVGPDLANAASTTSST